MTERVDDFLVLNATMERMGLAELFGEHFVVHGNWQGISPGGNADRLADLYLVGRRPSLEPGRRVDGQKA